MSLQSNKQRLRILTSILCFLLVTPNLFVALAQGTFAGVNGTVTDATGAAVPNAKVEIASKETGLKQTTTSDQQGRYTISQIPIGIYTVATTAPGFQRSVQAGVTLTVGAQANVNFSLQVGRVEQTVTVETASVAEVEHTSTSLDTLVAPNQMRELPLNGRDFESLITLSPGVVKQAGGSSFYGTGDNYSIAGSRPEGQAYLLDNTDVQNFWGHGTGSGALGTSLGVDAIAEFQLLSNTYSSQYGGNGAVMNAATRSGTNTYHGSAYEFFRNSALDAKNYFDAKNAKIPPFRHEQFGGTLGGPVKKDKLFFFANYEGVTEALGQTFVAFVPDAAARTGTINNADHTVTIVPITNASVMSTLAVYPLADPTLGSTNGIGRVNQTGTLVGSENYGVARVDYAISPKDSFFLRYGVDQAHVSIPNSASSPIPLWPETDTTFDHYVTMQYRHIFSDSLINLAQVSYVRNNEVQATTGNVPALQFLKAAPQNGNVAVTGLSTIGANNLFPSYEIQNRFGYEDDVVLNHKSHSFTFGFSVARTQDNTSAPFEVGAYWTFGGLAQFLSGKATNVTAPLNGQNNAQGFLRELTFATYFQDSWKATSRLTINAGLRYAPTVNPGQVHHQMYAVASTPLNPNGTVSSAAGSALFTPVPAAFSQNLSFHNIDPRFGVSYDPFPDHKTVIRAGLGVFHDIVLARTLLAGYWLNPPYALGALQQATYGPEPTGAASPISQAEGIYYGSNATPYQFQYNLNVQHSFGEFVATAGYVGSIGRNLFLMKDLNPPTNSGTAQNPILASQTVSATNLSGTGHARVQPSVQAVPGNIYSNLSYLEERYPGGISNYNSLQTSLTKRLSHNYSMQASYTYSKSLDTNSSSYGLEGSGGAAQLVQNPYDTYAGNQDYGRSTFDQTHVFQVNGVYQFPFKKNIFVQGYQVTGIFTSSTGTPWTPFVGFDRAGISEDSGGERPNLVSGCSNNPRVGKVSQFYNPACFSIPAVGTFGNLGRDTLIGPGFKNMDMALMKSTSIKKISEGFALQFRAEIFDVLNHPNFANVGSQNVFTSAGTANPTAGVQTATRGNQVTGGAQRTIQFGLKATF